jgi:hypothetical protein
VPDWSYRTVLRPALLALSPARAQRVAVFTLSALARAPLGLWLIDFLGHMRADARLSMRAGPVTVPGPVGLGSLIDPGGAACAALSRFGAGFVEIGPVAALPAEHAQPSWELDAATGVLRGAKAESVHGAAEVAARLARAGAIAAPVWVRIAAQDAGAIAASVDALRPWASAVLVDAVDGDSEDRVRTRVRTAVIAAAAPQTSPVLLSIRADLPGAIALAKAALDAGAVGVAIRGEICDGAGRRALGALTRDAVLAQLRALRAALPEGTLLVAGSVMAPADVRALAEAGATLTATDVGLVCSGPGLIKRCNEALSLASAPSPPPSPEPLSLAAARSAWFWAFWLGVAMLLGGALACVIASTRVVLPYDESLCGMNRAQLAALNPRLLPFMAHDRVTLAGSMLAVGVLYCALAWHGVRRGQHWAQVTVTVSALLGFLSFFLFLGFGYFDPFHAFVSAVLLQFTLCSLLASPSAPLPHGRPEWVESAAFRRGLWGQLLFIAIGAGLCGAGAVITAIGCTDVFVRSDLAFLRTTAAELLVAHDRLVPLIAHDRAGLGGMLLASGIAVWLSAQWGMRAGARWLWRAFAWGGNAAFLPAIAVHFAVGYTDPLHLAPALFGWALWWLALGLSRSWLCDP